MHRLSPEVVDKINDMVTQSVSLNKISESLSLSKSTVYYWYRKFKGRTFTKLVINSVNQEIIGEFIGAFAGDGNYTLDNDYKHQISISLNSKDLQYIAHLKNLLGVVCSKTPHVYTYDRDHVTVLRIVSKDLAIFIKSYLIWTKTKTATVELKFACKELGNSFVVGFLRGLMDTDGYINHKNEYVTFSTISPGLARNIETALSILGINFREYLNNDSRGHSKTVFRIRVTKDFKRFICLVQPKHFNYPNTDTISL
jgi:intein/homing endonuclease